jgi:hypothetical protein
MPRAAVLTLGVLLAFGAVVFALAWGHPYCVTNPMLCPSPSPGQTSLCSPGLHTSCSSAHVALRIGIAVVGVGAV